MYSMKVLVLILALTLAAVPAAAQANTAVQTGDAAALDAIRAQIQSLRTEYEKRIKELENQVEQLQLQMLRGTAEPEAATATAQPAPAVVQTSPGALNPAIAAVGNFVARADSQKVFSEDGGRADNRFTLREAEIDMRVPVDPYADAVLITALEQDASGKFTVGIEEGYVNIKKLPFVDRTPLGMRLKVGRFRPAFGKINVLHTHDLPQTFRPLPIQEFLGPEGFAQNGASANFFLPTPWDEKSSIDLTLEFLGGGELALSPNIESRNSYLGHLRWFRTFRDSHNLELGWSSYYRPNGQLSRQSDLHGFDLTYRWKPLRRGEWHSFLLGSEFMFARRAYPEAAESPDVALALEGTAPGSGRPLGYTVYGQWQFDRRTYAGVRWDRTDVLYNPALQRRGLTPYVSYYFSEFLRFRLNYEHRWSDLVTESNRNSVYAELNWIFGSHPPEPYWVNK
jgi:hypothetical protein